LSIKALRPALSRRIRGLGAVSLEAICLAPVITVLRLITAARETRLTPPRPSIFAPAPTTILFWRSSSNGRTAEKNSASCSSVTSTTRGCIARVIVSWALRQVPTDTFDVSQSITRPAPHLDLVIVKQSRVR
jgi:hypothetical protein